LALLATMVDYYFTFVFVVRSFVYVGICLRTAPLLAGSADNHGCFVCCWRTGEARGG